MLAYTTFLEGFVQNTIWYVPVMIELFLIRQFRTGTPGWKVG